MKATEFFSAVFQSITAIGGIISIIIAIELINESIIASIIFLVFGASALFTCAELDNLRAKTKLEEFSKFLDKLIQEEKTKCDK